MATISVIVPVYKVENYIHRCIDSILGQTYKDFELILIDDGSPDRCGEICDEYAQRDSRIHVIHQENGGLSSARNAGIDWVFANSESQWFTFVDSDDWIHPEMLERLLDAAVDANVAVSICGYMETDGEIHNAPQEQWEYKIWTTEDFFISCNTNATIACAKLYKKECFSEIRYPVGRIHEDEFTTYKILFAYPKIVATPMSMYYYFQNAAGITQSAWSPRRLDAVDAMEEQSSYFRANGYHSAYQMVALFCADIIVRSRELMKESVISDMDKAAYERALKKRLRKVLWKFRDVLTFQKERWLYQEAYPYPMAVYWKAMAVINKIKSVFGGR